MRKIYLKILLLIISFSCLAQKQGNIWYFGYGAGLDFSSGLPVAIFGSQIGTDIILGGNQEGTACISDSEGELLFYTGGKTIWNRYHSPMPNGLGLSGGNSSTHSSVILPLPGSDSIFYVFTSDEFQNYSLPNNQKGYCYSIVNMCLDNGNGDVVSSQKNILLCDSSTEKLAACVDATGNGFWIIGHKMFSNKFYAWHLTANGISNTIVSEIGTIHGWNVTTSSWNISSAQGQMKLCPSGNKIAVAIGNNDPAYLDLFDFNNQNGIISNSCHIVIDSSLQKRIYGIEFSPDGSKLYASLSGGSGGRRIYQYDITEGGGNCDSIISSKITIFQSNWYGILTGMQLAPNWKIYLIGNTLSDISCINYPNLTGSLADFDSVVVVTGNNGGYALPTFIAGYNYSNKTYNCQINIAENTKVNNIILGEVRPNPNDGNAEIDYYLPSSASNAKMVFIDMLGNIINEVNLSNGYGTIMVDTHDLPSGNYSFTLLVNGKVYDSKKMLRY